MLAIYISDITFRRKRLKPPMLKVETARAKDTNESENRHKAEPREHATRLVGHIRVTHRWSDVPYPPCFRSGHENHFLHWIHDMAFHEAAVREGTEHRAEWSWKYGTLVQALTEKGSYVRSRYKQLFASPIDMRETSRVPRKRTPEGSTVSRSERWGMTDPGTEDRRWEAEVTVQVLTTLARSPSSSLMTPEKLRLVRSRNSQHLRMDCRSHPDVLCSEG